VPLFTLASIKKFTADNKENNSYSILWLVTALAIEIFPFIVKMLIKRRVEMDINEKIKRFTVTDDEADQALEKLLQNYNLQNKLFDRFVYVMTQDYFEIGEELCDCGEISENQKLRLQCSLLKLKRQVVRYSIEQTETNKLSAKIKELTEYFKRIKAALSPKVRKKIEQNINNLHLELINKFEQLQLETMDLASIESEHQILVKRLEPRHPSLIWYNPKSKRYEFSRMSKKHKKK
jgi:hypothetical protein